LQERGMPVVIDAAPGLGATDPDGSFFAAGFPGCVVFSLHATKPFGIGEGGLVYSGSDDKVAAIRRLTNFGFTSPGISAAPGINAKMPEVAAAVGLAVLEGYTEKLQRLNLLFDSYIGHIDDSSVLSAAENTQRIRGNAPHQHMPLILPPSVDVESVQDRMSAAGIGTRRYFHPPCHLQEPLLNYRRGQVPNTDDIYQRILCLPLWDGMEAAMPGHIIGQLSALLAG
jgi:dTDP-4-amino-4,6-dideoxygalactose transaminase